MIRFSLAVVLSTLLLTADSCIPDKTDSGSCVSSSSSSQTVVNKQTAVKSSDVNRTSSIYIKNLGGEKDIESFIKNISRKADLKVTDIVKKNEHIYFVWFTEKNRPLKYLTYIVVFDGQPFLAIGSLFNRYGENVTEKEILSKNRSYIEKMKKDIASQRLAFFSNNRNRFIHIKGEGENGSVYLFIDPSCPYCKQIEERGIVDNIKKRVKDLYIVPTPLYSIHPDAVDRTVWLREKYKGNSETSNLLHLYQASHKSIKEIRDEIKNLPNLEEKRADVRRDSDFFLSSAIVKGTPTLINEKGEKLDFNQYIGR